MTASALTLAATQPLHVRFADIVLALHIPAHLDRSPFVARLATFATDAPASVDVRWQPAGPLSALSGPIEPLFDSGTYWCLDRSSEAIRIALHDGGERGAPYCQLLISPDLTAIDIHVTDAILADPQHLATLFVYPLSELLLIIALAATGGLLVHACGLDDDGRGYLFAGNSGHGKSTTARLWQGQATLLNDDRIALRERDGAIWMYGTPWHGDVDQIAAAGVPLHQLFVLAHGAINRAVPLEPSMAAAQLISRSFPPLWDAAGMTNTLAFVEQVVTRVPCAQLEFVPGPAAVAYARTFAGQDR